MPKRNHPSKQSSHHTLTSTIEPEPKSKGEEGKKATPKKSHHHKTSNARDISP